MLLWHCCLVWLFLLLFIGLFFIILMFNFLACLHLWLYSLCDINLSWLFYIKGCFCFIFDNFITFGGNTVSYTHSLTFSIQIVYWKTITNLMIFLNFLNQCLVFLTQRNQNFNGTLSLSLLSSNLPVVFILHFQYTKFARFYGILGTCWFCNDKNQFWDFLLCVRDEFVGYLVIKPPKPLFQVLISYFACFNGNISGSFCHGLHIRRYDFVYWPFFLLHLSIDNFSWLALPDYLHFFCVKVSIKIYFLGSMLDVKCIAWQLSLKRHDVLLLFYCWLERRIVFLN